MDAKWWKQCDPKLSERGRVIESYVEEGKGDSRVTGIPGSLEGESVGMSTVNLGLPISRYFLCAWLGSALRFQSSHCCYQREGVHILCTVGYLAVSLVVTAHSCPSSVMSKNVFRWYLVLPGRQITPLRTSVKVTSLPHQR